MTDHATPIATLIERAEDYSKTTFELFKMQAIDKSADVFSSLVSRFAVLMAFVLSILTINIGIALWLGILLGSAYYGFFVIGVLYAFIAILLLFFGQQWIKTPVSNSIILQMLKKKVDEK
jgi:uncharacterized membrane protein